MPAPAFRFSSLAGIGELAGASRWMRAFSGIPTIFASSGNGGAAVATGGWPKAREREMPGGNNRTPATRLRIAKRVHFIGARVIIEDDAWLPEDAARLQILNRQPLVPARNMERANKSPRRPGRGGWSSRRWPHSD